jgi:hypothetical protein
MRLRSLEQSAPFLAYDNYPSMVPLQHFLSWHLLQRRSDYLLILTPWSSMSSAWPQFWSGCSRFQSAPLFAPFACTIFGTQISLLSTNLSEPSGMACSHSLWSLSLMIVCFHMSSDNDVTILTTTSGTHHPIDITPFTQLRSITFVLGAGRGVNRNQWVMQILSHISSPHLEDVVFKIHFSHSRAANVSDALEWCNVDSILQRSTFSGLRNVHFRCNFPSSVFGSTSDGPQSSSACASIMEHLPQCHARGIFRVDRWS